MNPEHQPTEPETETEMPPVFQAVVAEKNDAEIEAQMRRMSRRSFLWAALAGAGTLGGFNWLNTRRADDGIPWPLRRVLDINGEIARDMFSTARLSPTFAASLARKPRVNGDLGMGEDFDPQNWQLSLAGLASGAMMDISLAQIKALPRVEMTTELKCIEGWSEIVTWAGARFVDFIAKYPPATQSGEAPDVAKKPADLMPYVSLATPDGAYYVGLDIESAMHPQTLLCYEMNGRPLASEHGAPLRLVAPVKYGIKYIKRIGSIEFTAQKPPDYWAQRGYDWYSGH